MDKVSLRALFLNAGINSLITASTTASSASLEYFSYTVPLASSTPTVADIQSPIIILNSSSTIEIPIGTAWVDPGATVTDNVNYYIHLH